MVEIRFKIRDSFWFFQECLHFLTCPFYIPLRFIHTLQRILQIIFQLCTSIYHQIIRWRQVFHRPFRVQCCRRLSDHQGISIVKIVTSIFPKSLVKDILCKVLVQADALTLHACLTIGEGVFVVAGFASLWTVGFQSHSPALEVIVLLVHFYLQHGFPLLLNHRLHFFNLIFKHSLNLSEPALHILNYIWVNYVRHWIPEHQFLNLVIFYLHSLIVLFHLLVIFVSIVWLLSCWLISLLVLFL